MRYNRHSMCVPGRLQSAAPSSAGCMPARTVTGKKSHTYAFYCSWLISGLRYSIPLNGGPKVRIPGLCPPALNMAGSRNSSVSIVSTLGTGPTKDQEINLFSKAARADLGPTHPLFKWAPETLRPGIKRPVFETDHSNLVPRLRMSKAMPLRPHTLS